MGPFEQRRDDGWLLLETLKLEDGSTVTRSTDITLLKESEIALKSSEAQFRDFAEVSTDRLWETDEIHRFTYLSDSAQSDAMPSSSIGIGKTRWELAGVDPTSDPKWKSHMADLKARRPFRNFTITTRAYTGAICHISISGKPVFYDDGSFKGYRGAAADITEREELVRLKNEFLSTASHELRTPLTSLKGSLQLVAGGVMGKLPAKIKPLIEIASNNSERLSKLVDDILDMEKIVSGTLKYKFEPIELISFAKAAIKANEGYGIQFDIKYEVKSSLKNGMVKGDRDRLNQVLANLLSNASKFSSKGALVELSIRHINGMLRVAVKDFGTGIPEESQKHIFDKFYQADASDTRQVNGTGLGLSISSEIIEKHDGALRFVSRLGRGSKFFFDLPVYKELNNP